jgi:hypothetical protein
LEVYRNCLPLTHRATRQGLQAACRFCGLCMMSSRNSLAQDVSGVFRVRHGLHAFDEPEVHQPFESFARCGRWRVPPVDAFQRREPRVQFRVAVAVLIGQASVKPSDRGVFFPERSRAHYGAKGYPAATFLVSLLDTLLDRSPGYGLSRLALERFNDRADGPACRHATLEEEVDPFVPSTSLEFRPPRRWMLALHRSINLLTR